MVAESTRITNVRTLGLYDGLQGLSVSEKKQTVTSNKTLLTVSSSILRQSGKPKVKRQQIAADELTLRMELYIRSL